MADEDHPVQLTFSNERHGVSLSSLARYCAVFRNERGVRSYRVRSTLNGAEVQAFLAALAGENIEITPSNANNLEALAIELQFTSLRQRIAAFRRESFIRRNSGAVALPSPPTTVAFTSSILPSLPPSVDRLVGWRTFKLLYRGQTDGFRAADFHTRCDGYANTLTVIRSDKGGQVFGGFTPIPWDSPSVRELPIPDSVYERSDFFRLSFLFNSDTVFPLLPDEFGHAIYCSPFFGPTFGHGWGSADLLISNSANHPSHFRGFGRTYAGSALGPNPPTFAVRDIEVFEAAPDNVEDKLHSVILKRLPPILSQFHGQTLTRVYCASRDGREPAVFHRCCDDIGPVLCIVKPFADRPIVGGYSAVGFASEGGRKDELGDSFLFSLDPPERLSITKRAYAVRWDRSVGIEFVNSYGSDQASLSVTSDSYLLHRNCEEEVAPGRYSDVEVFCVSGERPFNNLRVGALDSVIVLGLPEALARFAGRRIELVFRSSRDGLTVRDFHRVCDGLGRTIVLIATPNCCVFGGYSPCVWAPGTGEDDACESFLFSIHNPHNIPAVLPFIDGVAITHDNGAGPIFGENDLVVNDVGVSLRGWLGEAYRNSTDKGNLLFTGTEMSEIAEMEVFQVLPN